MKKHFKIATAFVLTISLILGASGVAYGTTPVITDKNIKEGLEFCKEWPVSLTLDDKLIEFGEKDVPTVIITPQGEKNGRTLIPVRALFEAMGATVTWYENSQCVIITLGEQEVELYIGSELAWVNGHQQSIDVPALVIDHDGDFYGSTMIPVRFAATALGCTVGWDDVNRIVKVTSPKVQNPIIGGGGSDDGNKDYTFPTYSMSDMPKLTGEAKSKLVFIDIGHGGKDPGAVINEDTKDEMFEKDFNYEVALLVKKYLEDSGANIKMQRETDMYNTLIERTDMANSAGADMFVSIHHNYSDNATASGSTVYYWDKVNTQGETLEQLYGMTSKEIATSIQKELVSALGTTSRGTKEGSEYAVINKSKMPAVIVEVAFMSNEKDLKMLTTEDCAERSAYAIAKGIIETLNQNFGN